VSSRNRAPESGGWGAGKFIALALSVLAVLGVAAYFFLRDVPEPVVATPARETPAEPAPAKRPEPEPAPPPRDADLPRTGSLFISASVDGASVYVDDELVGTAPVTRDDVPAGRYRLRVEAEGHEPFTTEVRVRAGQRNTVEVSLAVLAPSLRVDSDVPGATVFFDRNYVGTTPVEVENVSPGEHELTVSADGYDMYAETVSVESGRRDVRVSFKEVSLGETIAVVHKHRMGSCEGTLIADNQGLRYQTSNKNDAFSVPFASLEQFEVDYLDKNLKVKIRQGRNYNFTDKSGNADNLFVFHKNVQAFREKL
jgi:hypothetical protein